MEWKDIWKRSRKDDYVSQFVPVIEKRKGTVCFSLEARHLPQKMCGEGRALRVISFVGKAQTGKTSRVQAFLKVQLEETLCGETGLWMWGSPERLADGSLLIVFDCQDCQTEFGQLCTSIAGFLSYHLVIMYRGVSNKEMECLVKQIIQDVPTTRTKRHMYVWITDIAKPLLQNHSLINKIKSHWETTL